VYKTRGDYSSLVPVALNAEKTAVVSFPDRSDICGKQEEVRPTGLHNGYLLDNRGISASTVFLDLTFEEYCGLAEELTPQGLLERVADFDPFTELYDCGNRAQFTSLVEGLNSIIDAGALESECRAM
jgi:hypothetical protein